jgi:hypothetical protein
VGAPRTEQSKPASETVRDSDAERVPGSQTKRAVQLARRRLRGRAGIAAALLTLTAVAVIAAIALTRGDHVASPNSAETMMESGGFPDAIESELVLAHVPESIRPTCRRTKNIAAASFLRSVRCASETGLGAVTYSRAHSGDALRAYLLQRVQDVGLRYPTAWTCRNRRPAADEWLREGQQTHVEKPSLRAEGRLLCYRDEQRVWMAWTDTPTKLLAEASSGPSAWPKLYSWWRDVAGPEKQLAMEDSMMAGSRYPDAIEKELLLAHIPPEVQKTCRRATDFNKSVFLRAVRCSQSGAADSVEYMYAHSGSALRSFSTDQITAAGLNYPTTDRCANANAAADTWIRMNDSQHAERHFTRRASGRVLCFATADRAVLEWTDWPTGIYARATRPAERRASLYRWWMMDAGPGALEMRAMEGGDAIPMAP